MNRHTSKLKFYIPSRLPNSEAGYQQVRFNKFQKLVKSYTPALRIIVCLIFLFVISACSKVDKCTVDDWVGSYSAEVICEVSGSAQGIQIDTTITLPLENVAIIKIDDQTIIMDDGGLDNPEIIVNGCEITIDTTLSSTNQILDGGVTYVLEGDQIIGITQIEIDQIEFICESIFTREN